MLLYAASTASHERNKKNAALEHETAVALVESWLRFHIQDVTVSVLRNAFAASQRWQISYWDAAIVEAAREAGCATLLSEDLQDGMDFAGVRVVNPFLTTPHG